jgi:hypothetical protein
MPAKSKAQQKAAGITLSAKKGDKKKSDLKGPSKSMYESMSQDQLEELAAAGDYIDTVFRRLANSKEPESARWLLTFPEPPCSEQVGSIPTPHNLVSS